ncbi:hypothetical protein ES708_26498 [subsurface metagenome]
MSGNPLPEFRYTGKAQVLEGVFVLVITPAPVEGYTELEGLVDITIIEYFGSSLSVKEYKLTGIA